MTSTIAPPSDSFLLAVNGVEQRLEQYATSARFYFSLLRDGVFDRVVYTDNSGHPLDALMRIADEMGVSDRVEFLSYVQDVPANNSRYYLEIHLIDRAMRMSATLARHPDAVVWKVTGRYIVRNAKKIVQSWPKGTDVYIHHRNHPSPVVDFYFFGFVNRTYPQHIGRDFDDYKGLADGEKILRRKIDEGAFAGVRFTRRFRHTPRLEGIRGFDGMRYSGLKYSLKHAVRATANLLLPGWWI